MLLKKASKDTKRREEKREIKRWFKSCVTEEHSSKRGNTEAETTKSLFFNSDFNAAK